MHQYGNDIWAYIFSLVGNHSAADDLAQETFIRCWLYKARFRGDSSVKTWLFVIAKNVCRDHFRSAFIRKVKPESPSDLAGRMESSDVSLDVKADVSDVWEDVMKLDTKYREILILRLRQELSFKEIAKVTGVNAGTLRIRYQRALKQLRTHLQKGDDAGE